MGAATTTTSAISTTERSVFALATTSRSSALRTTTGFGSLPTTTTSGRATFKAWANEEPIRPSPTTATVATQLYASCFCIAPSTRRTSAIIRSNASKSSDCAPSDSA